MGGDLLEHQPGKDRLPAMADAYPEGGLSLVTLSKPCDRLCKGHAPSLGASETVRNEHRKTESDAERYIKSDTVHKEYRKSESDVE